MMNKIIICAIALAPLINAQGPPSIAESAASPGSGVVTKELGEAILNELHQIRALLEKQLTMPQAAPVPETAKISSAGFSIGRADAPLTLVEFADYQCPFCRQFHSAVYERLKKDYIDTGKVKFVSRDLPLEFHSNALAAARASRCAADQNKFWEMRETLILHADKLDADAITGYAQPLSFEMKEFHACLASNKYLQSIRADVAEAQETGIVGTPTFVLGKTRHLVLKG